MSEILEKNKRRTFLLGRSVHVLLTYLLTKSCRDVTSCADVFSPHDADVDVRTEALSNDTCDVRLRMTLSLDDRRREDRPAGDRAGGRGNAEGARDRARRVDGVGIACTRCRHDQRIQLSVSVSRNHARKVSKKVKVAHTRLPSVWFRS